jgi:hypothetical protein
MIFHQSKLDLVCGAFSSKLSSRLACLGLISHCLGRCLFAAPCEGRAPHGNKASIRSTYQFRLLRSTDQREDQQSQTNSPLLLCLISLELHEHQQLASIAPRLAKISDEMGTPKSAIKLVDLPKLLRKRRETDLPRKGNVVRVRGSVGEGSR